ncbi:MAG: sulfatase-like hydrolase/transferase [Gammaproteobacteria bacterium]|nr:sulfatase-like hydrolase/transferase [Gammaproteobacteria bacterium]
MAWHHSFVVVFASFPILHIASGNLGQVPLDAFWLAMGVSAIAAVALTVMLRSIARSWAHAACAGAVLIGLFYSYGPVHGWIESSLFQLAERGSASAENASYRLHSWMTPTYLIAAVAVTWFVCRRWKGPAPRLLSALNVVALLLVTFPVLQILTAAGADHAAGSESKAADDITTLEAVPRGGSTGQSVLGYRPDIYYVILDGYARADVLERYYGYDNQAFIEELQHLGFQVDAASFANYYWTFLSLASSLNMNYLQDLFGTKLQPGSTDRASVYEAIRDNEIARFLRARGYRIVHFRSTWGATLANPYADQQIECHSGIFQQEFYRVLADATWLKALQAHASGDLARCHLSNLDTLAAMGAKAGPKFVFAHFLPPHHPYLFDQDGGIRRNATLSDQFEFQKRLWEKRDLYVEQLRYMNKRIAQAVGRILQESPRPPIIVIQSDHGPQLSVGITNPERIRIRLANLAAVHAPGASGLMPQGGSPVNQFRLILSHYFGADLPPLEQRHYRSDFRTPYDFVTVSPSDPGDRAQQHSSALIQRQ